METKVNNCLGSYRKKIENLRWYLGTYGRYVTIEERLLIRQRIKDFQDFIDTLEEILEYDK